MSEHCNTITAIAIDNDKNSHYALKWAIENILIDSPNCVLLHVQTRSGENTEADTVDDDDDGGYDDDDDDYKFFLPFRGFCNRKGVIAKEVILQDHDICNAIINYINTNNLISNIVIGSSNSFFKKIKNTDLPTNLLKRLPETCGAFVVSKGKLMRSKSANHRPQVPQSQPLASLMYGFDPKSSISNDSERESLNKPNSVASPQLSLTKTSQSEIGNESGLSEASTVSSYSISEQSTTNGSSSSSTSTVSSLILQKEQNQKNQNLGEEVRRLRLELQQYNASKGRLKEKNEAIEMPKALSEREKQKRQTAMKVAEMVKRLAKLESQKKRLLQMQAKVSYRRYSIRDVEDATNGFSNELKIGEGGYGPVYKAVLDYTPVAIKILKSGVTQGLKQFKQEIEVLSCMRHPNMVILLGACPEYGCLVYEYMENGTLEDRLFCRNNTPPLSWRTRFRIAAEIATGLLFLHQAKPEPLVHRDLKPANILLDRYFVSKISDVGLARLVPPSMAGSLTQYHMTSAAGTFCYIDPEYQQTGMLGVKSDLYSFGVVLLQIITALPAMGLGLKVEMAIENNMFRDILDPAVSEWPEEETLVLAKLALQCCELRKKDRPDLASVLLPALKRLREFATEDYERVRDRTSYESQTHNSALLNQVSPSQINKKKKKTMAVPEIDGPASFNSRCESMPSRRKPPRSQRSQYKDMFWSFISCAPPKPKWYDLP